MVDDASQRLNLLYLGRADHILVGPSVLKAAVDERVGHKAVEDAERDDPLDRGQVLVDPGVYNHILLSHKALIRRLHLPQLPELPRRLTLLDRMASAGRCTLKYSLPWLGERLNGRHQVPVRGLMRHDAVRGEKGNGRRHCRDEQEATNSQQDHFHVVWWSFAPCILGHKASLCESTHSVKLCDQLSRLREGEVEWDAPSQLTHSSMKRLQ
mmetsp:Transcript_51066/g.128144  ORF Transcript_51066/g.128144 Transcript_51066/m.128144 type:complete len:211 (+) Transcript_51066:317-949(+)